MAVTHMSGHSTDATVSAALVIGASLVSTMPAGD